MAERENDRRIEELEENRKPSGRPRPDESKETEEAIERIHGQLVAQDEEERDDDEGRRDDDEGAPASQATRSRYGHGRSLRFRNV